MEDPFENLSARELEQEDEPDEHGDSRTSPAESFNVGFVAAPIHLRDYRGSTNRSEMVSLVREPGNPSDPTAIKVLNMRSEQVGYIDGFIAAVLSPMIDQNLITVEGSVPGRSSSADIMPCQIHIFTRFELIETIRSHISDGGLHVMDLSGPGFAMSELVAAKERSRGSKNLSVDEIFSSVDTEKKVDIMEPPEIITTPLFQHQKEGLGWLVHRENSLELPPFWEEDAGTFKNTLTDFKSHERPEPLRGGILADEMGLGKTLTLISLIALNRPDSVLRWKSNKQVWCSQKKRRRDGEIVDRNDMINEPPSISGPRTTLVVCPTSVISTWKTELKAHTKPDTMGMYLYHGERTKEAKELMGFDIVLTTYSTLAAELVNQKSPIKQIEWLRVILDEAHVVKNTSTKLTKAVIALQSKRRWAVTGTPIQNSSFDLFALMAFLKFQPFSIKSHWQRLVQRLLDRGDRNGIARLQALMGTISLRRTKDMQTGILIGLPSKTVSVCSVELSMVERELYDKIEGSAKKVVREYIHSGTALRNYSTVLQIILRLRQICNDIALCPPDIESELPSISIEDVSNNPELLKKMLSTLQDGDDFDCPVCFQPPKRAIITRCTHVCCHTCIKRILKSNPRCPLCRYHLTESDIFSAPPQYDNLPGSVSRKTTSSKVHVLQQLLTADRDENSGTKSIVFSQFRKMLLLLQEPLRDAGFETLMLDGSMIPKKRIEVIKEFGKSGPGGPTVLLASLKAAGARINLTAASRVYLMDPWWNPAVEDQAMDRVHRIGQRYDVKVVRMIVRNSIEERIMHLQEKKRILAENAFGKMDGKERKQMHLDNLQAIMGL